MSDSKGAAIDELLKYFWPTPFPQGKPPIEVTFNNGELVFQVPYHTFKTAILAILAQEVNKARIDELNLLIKDAAPLMPKESWEDWSWRVQKYLKERLERLG